jgi:hypothetical protein
MSMSKSSRIARATALASLGLLAIALVVTPLASAAGPTWSVVRNVADGGRPSAGSSIATTKSSTTRYLHATWRQGAGKVRFARSANGGVTWTSSRVLGNTTMVFGEPSVATSGNDVWVAWARTYEDPDTGTPGMGIKVRHNGAHGASSAWGQDIRLTSTSGDVRAPSIAVSNGGESIFVIFSDLRNDTTRLIYSHDGGHAWTSAIVGTGFDEDAEGVPTTIPVVAAAGNNVIVGWLAEGNLAMARTSTDGGDHWSDEAEVGEGLSSASALGARLAIAGRGEEGPWLRVWQSGEWSDLRAIPEITLEGETATAVQLDVALNTEGRVGVAYSAQVDVDEETADTWEEITWFTSANDGVAWSGPTRVSRAGSETQAFNADRPSVVWLASGRLWISWLQEKASAPGTSFFALRERS